MAANRVIEDVRIAQSDKGKFIIVEFATHEDEKGNPIEFMVKILNWTEKLEKKWTAYIGKTLTRIR